MDVLLLFGLLSLSLVGCSFCFSVGLDGETGDDNVLLGEDGLRFGEEDRLDRVGGGLFIGYKVEKYKVQA